MPDPTTLSPARLRRLARRLGHERPESLPLPALREWVAPRLAVQPASGRLVLRRHVAAMTVRDEEPVEAHGLGTLGSGSGAGPKDVVPLEAAPEPIPDLPWAYEDDRVVLLVRDPRTLFGYWDFHPDTVARAMSGVGEAPRAVLRLIDLSGSEPKAVFEKDADLGWRSFYFEGVEPNREYRFECVFVGKTGEALVGRRSNIVQAPPNRPSAWVEDRFASIPLDVSLPEAGVFAQGRIAAGEGERRLHGRAWELSGGETMVQEGPPGSSDQSYARGFGGRGWSGSLVRK